MPDLIYRDYIARYKLLGQRWVGTIHPPGSQLILPPTSEVSATEAEGESVFIARAKARIDQDIAEIAERNA